MAGNQPFAARLKAARLRKTALMKTEGKGGFSQERLGVEAGIEEASASARMNQYEQGVHAPDISLAIRFADILDVPLAYLYCLEDDLADLLIAAKALSSEQRTALTKHAEELKKSISNK